MKHRNTTANRKQKQLAGDAKSWFGKAVAAQ